MLSSNNHGEVNNLLTELTSEEAVDLNGGGALVLRSEPSWEPSSGAVTSGPAGAAVGLAAGAQIGDKAGDQYCKNNPKKLLC